MLLKRLSEAHGFSGAENEIRDVIRDEIKDLVDEMRTDSLGNLITYKKGKIKGPVVMLAAHMDEVGLMITYIKENGLLRFSSMGIDPRVLVAKKVLIGPNKIPGIIGSKPVHLQSKSERKNAIPPSKLYIDIGAKNKEDAKKLVNLGDIAIFDTSFAEINQNYIKGKAFDDRAGCAVLIEILKKDLDLPIYAAFTVQEEVGARGASIVAHDIEPDLALVIEGTTASDVPGSSEHTYSTSLGDGPAISLMDRSVIAHSQIVRGLIKTAEENNLKYQFRRTNFGGTDAGKIHLTKAGIPSAVISIPCRYIHSPVSLMHLDDLNTLVKLVSKYLENIAKGGFTK